MAQEQSINLTTLRFSLLLSLAILLEAAGYLAFPFLSVRLRDHFGFSSQDLGTLLMVAFWTRPLASLMVSQFSSFFSPASLSVISCLLEALCFLGLAFGKNVYIASSSLILGNIGLALWRPGLFASVYNDLTHPKRSQRVSLLNGALNSGSVVGCLAGALLAQIDMKQAFIYSGYLYILLMAPVFLLMRSRSVEKNRNDSFTANRKVCFPRPLYFIALTVATVCAWATISQFTIYMSLLATDYLLETSYTSFGFIVSALTVVTVSIFLSRVNNLNKKMLIISLISSVLAFCGWGLVSSSKAWSGLTSFVVLMSIFEAVSVVVIAEQWAGIGAIKGQSWNYTIRCIGQGVGGLIGGVLYSKAGGPLSLLPWIMANWMLLIFFCGSIIVLKKVSINSEGSLI